MKEQRISLLSLRQVWEKPGIFVFSALVIAYNILVGWYEIEQGKGFTETCIAIVGHMTNCMPYAFFLTMVGFEIGGWLMIKYRMFMDERAQRIAKAKAQGIAEGKAQGIAEGKAQGITEGKAQGIAEGKAQGIAEGKAQGITEGKAEGKTEGIVERDREWTAWNERRKDAAAKGQPFDEPPPSSTPTAPPQ